jgi:hypothetical protein
MTRDRWGWHAARHGQRFLRADVVQGPPGAGEEPGVRDLRGSHTRAVPEGRAAVRRRGVAVRRARQRRVSATAIRPRLRAHAAEAVGVPRLPDTPAPAGPDRSPRRLLGHHEAVAGLVRVAGAPKDGGGVVRRRRQRPRGISPAHPRARRVPGASADPAHPVPLAGRAPLARPGRPPPAAGYRSIHTSQSATGEPSPVTGSQPGAVASELSRSSERRCVTTFPF